MLGELAIGATDRLGALVEHDAGRAGGALVDRQDHPVAAPATDSELFLSRVIWASLSRRHGLRLMLPAEPTAREVHAHEVEQAGARDGGTRRASCRWRGGTDPNRSPPRARPRAWRRSSCRSPCRSRAQTEAPGERLRRRARCPEMGARSYAAAAPANRPAGEADRQPEAAADALGESRHRQIRLPLAHSLHERAKQRRRLAQVAVAQHATIPARRCVSRPERQLRRSPPIRQRLRAPRA